MLHPYATDSNERKQIPFFLAGLAILSAIGLWWILVRINWPSWLDAPGALGFYGIYYELFRRYVWKGGFFRELGIVRIPMIAGTWRGHVITSFDEQKGKHPIEAEINQNWTHLSVKMKSQYSRSESLVGSVLVGTDVVLDYEYWNEPLPGAAATMHAHRGTATLRYDVANQVLEGEYYSGRDRQNYGSLYLKKTK